MLVSDYQLGRLGRLPARRNYPGYGRFGAFGGEWEDWCDNNYGADPTLLAKCRRIPSPFTGGLPCSLSPVAFAPWTDCGKTQRGLPPPVGSIVGAFKTASQVLKTVTTGAANVASSAAAVIPTLPSAGPPPLPVQPSAPSADSLFTTPRSFMPTTAGGQTGLAIAAVAGIGLVALLILKKK